MGDSPKETTSSCYFDRSQVDGECRIGFSTSKGDNSLTLWENHSGGLLGSPKALICLLTETLKTQQVIVYC